MTPANSPDQRLAEATSAQTRSRLQPQPLLSRWLPERPVIAGRTPAPQALQRELRVPAARSHPVTVLPETSSCRVACQKTAPGIPPDPAPSADRIPSLPSAHRPLRD